MRSMRNPPPHLKNSERISHYVARVMISISIFSREQGGKDNFTTPPPLCTGPFQVRYFKDFKAQW